MSDAHGQHGGWDALGEHPRVHPLFSMSAPRTGMGWGPLKRFGALAPDHDLNTVDSVARKLMEELKRTSQDVETDIRLTWLGMRLT